MKIDRYGPLGFYHLADFCRAAVHSASLENSKPRLHYNLVLYHLHTHSIELALKAFLRVHIPPGNKLNYVDPYDRGLCG